MARTLGRQRGVVQTKDTQTFDGDVERAAPLRPRASDAGDLGDGNVEDLPALVDLRGVEAAAAGAHRPVVLLIRDTGARTRWSTLDLLGDLVAEGPC